MRSVVVEPFHAQQDDGDEGASARPLSRRRILKRQPIAAPVTVYRGDFCPEGCKSMAAKSSHSQRGTVQPSVPRCSSLG